MAARYTIIFGVALGGLVASVISIVVGIVELEQGSPSLMNTQIPLLIISFACLAVVVFADKMLGWKLGR